MMAVDGRERPTPHELLALLADAFTAGELAEARAALTPAGQGFFDGTVQVRAAATELGGAA
jgi:hypothetical protein